MRYKDRYRSILITIYTVQNICTYMPIRVVSPDGQLLVTTTWIGNGVRLWNTQSGELIADLAPTAGHSTPEFSPDGKWLAVSTNLGEHLLWNVPLSVGKLDSPQRIPHSGAQGRGGIAF